MLPVCVSDLIARSYSKALKPGRGGGVLPYMGYIGICSPKGRVSILADFGHFGHKQGIVFTL